MTSRGAILAAVRANAPAPLPSVPPVPLFDRVSKSLPEQFRETLLSMGGKLAPAADGDELDALMRSLFPDAASICSATPEVRGTRPFDGDTPAAALADVDVGVVLLDPTHIVGNLHQAYRDRRFWTARYAVLVTGPSATADIEGVLIHGAQGVRSLTVAMVPPAEGGDARQIELVLT